MAQQVDCDHEDDFKLIKTGIFGAMASTTTCPSITSLTSNQHIPNIEKSIEPASIKTDQTTVNEAQFSSLVNTNPLPTRYGAASMIPRADGFDMKSIINSSSSSSSRPSLPTQTNDFMSILKDEKTKKQSYNNDHIRQILADNNNDIKALLQSAKKAQQDFLDAINLD
ncbi:unnamed protein product [Rotaria socialis]|uniref:Uncharacterized protein n=2 Tax=Rotaria socialis TaxID=392032 RepID=A0A817ZEI9_9BILA|nr:unnamed protein product [Rotaria socialis]CAF3461945.1 unnamed protein product [Rotaria socialis]CAF3528372.1 unnamed protein product [Rotaria socialis]CAF4343236.1 unnamed protein product [Rotaria socialis]